MIKTSKCYEYYLDARTYGSQEIQESIEETKKEFHKKNVEVYVSLNDYGMYVITFYFQSKYKNCLSKIKIWFKSKTKNRDRRLLLEEKKYGQYESKGIYRPY